MEDPDVNLFISVAIVVGVKGFVFGGAIVTSAFFVGSESRLINLHSKSLISGIILSSMEVLVLATASTTLFFFSGVRVLLGTKLGGRAGAMFSSVFFVKKVSIGSESQIQQSRMLD